MTGLATMNSHRMCEDGPMCCRALRVVDRDVPTIAG
jgi:hypothetical protein